MDDNQPELPWDDDVVDQDTTLTEGEDRGADSGSTDLDPVRELPVGKLQGGMIHHMAHGAVAVSLSFRHGVNVPVGSIRPLL